MLFAQVAQDTALYLADHGDKFTRTAVQSTEVDLHLVRRRQRLLLFAEFLSQLGE